MYYSEEWDTLSFFLFYSSNKYVRCSYKLSRENFKSVPDERKVSRVLEIASSDVTDPITPETHEGIR